MNVEITEGWDGFTIAGLGRADGWKDAFARVRAWAEEHTLYYGYQDEAWGYTRKPGGVTIVDFGSHRYFARYVEVPE